MHGTMQMQRGAANGRPPLRPTLVQRAYAVTSRLIGPALPIVLARRRARGKEDPVRLGERMGIPGCARPPGPLVWVHGASVGESLSALPLIERLLAERPGLNTLVTTGTRTSAAILAQRLPPRAIHQFVPVDRPDWCRRFLDHWRPDAALWLESDLWPNLLHQMARRGIPAALLNARMSARSAARWARLPQTTRALFSTFRVILPLDAAEATRLRALGAAAAEPVGNLKLAAAPLPVDADRLEAVRQAVVGRPIWLAASTHPGEEEIIAAAHRRLATTRPDLLTLIAPRHPERGTALDAQLTAAGLSVARRATGALPDADTAVYLADTVGEMGLWYRLSPLSVIGGSLHPVGGHNPVEPARLGSAVLFGPHMFNFADEARAMVEAGAARSVAAPSVAEDSDADALAAAVAQLLDDAADRTRMAAAATALVDRRAAGILDRTVAALAPVFANLDAAPATGSAPRAEGDRVP